MNGKRIEYNTAIALLEELMNVIGAPELTQDMQWIHAATMVCDTALDELGYMNHADVWSGEEQLTSS